MIVPTLAPVVTALAEDLLMANGHPFFVEIVKERLDSALVCGQVVLLTQEGLDPGEIRVSRVSRWIHVGDHFYVKK